MIYANIETQERAILQAAIKSRKSAKQYLRNKAFDLPIQGYQVPKIAKLFNLMEHLWQFLRLQVSRNRFFHY